MKLELAEKMYLHFTNTTLQDLQRVFKDEDFEYYRNEQEELIVTIKQDWQNMLPMRFNPRGYAYVIREKNFANLRVALTPAGVVEYSSKTGKVKLMKDMNGLLYISHGVETVSKGVIQEFEGRNFMIFTDKPLEEKWHQEIEPVISVDEPGAIMIKIDEQLSQKLINN